MVDSQYPGIEDKDLYKAENLRFHYEEINRLLELDVLDPNFYSDLKLNSNKESIILRNLILWFFDGVEKEFAYEEAHDFYYEFQEQLDVSSAYMYWDSLRTTKEKDSLDIKLDKNNFEEHFRKVCSIYFGEKLYNEFEDPIQEYTKSCLQFIEFAENRKSKENKIDVEDINVKILRFLHFAGEHSSMEYVVTNHVLRLFNQFCLSVLKAEYIIEDEFSDKLSSWRENLKEQRIQMKINRLLHDKQNNNSSQKESKADNEEELKKKIAASFWQKCNVLADVYSDKSAEIALILSGVDKDISNNYVPYYKAFSDICREFFIFNRKIDTFIEVKEQPVKIQNYFDAEEKYKEKYEEACTRYFNIGLSIKSNLLEICKMLPYLFRKILDMSIIDHNIISSADNFKELLSLDELLDGSKSHSKMGFLDILSKLKTYGDIAEDAVDDLYKTLQLIRYKNGILIYKILDRTGDRRDFNRYEYIGEHQVLLLSGSEPERKFQITKEAEDYLYDDKDQDELLKEYSYYKSKKGQKEKLRKYENIYLDILREKDDFELCIKKYEALKEEMEKQVDLLSFDKKRDITNYNQAILGNLKRQFIKYGYWLKRLQIEVGRESNEQYLNQVLRFLQTKEKKNVGILSCSFIRKHMEWALSCLQDKITSTDPNDKSGFEYVKLIHQLLSYFENLIQSIENGFYCLNYSSLFQDCFYQYTFPSGKLKNIWEYKLSSISRCPQVKSTESFRKGTFHEDIIFISSAWQPATDMSWLKKEYHLYTKMSDMLTVEFYNNYYKQVLESRIEQKMAGISRPFEEKMGESNRLVKEELDDNKRTMVQVLGIFATFLALATVFVGTLKAADGYKEYLKVMFSITICLCIFVILLHFVIGRRRRHPIMNLVGLSLITLFVLLLGLFLFIL